MILAQTISSVLLSCLVSVASAAAFCPGGSAEPTSATLSPRFNYFQKVLAKGERATVSELLQFWSAEKHGAIAPSQKLLSCQVEPWGGIRTNAVGDITPECKPDIIYSWGSSQKLNTIAETLIEGKTWTGSPNPGGHSGIYATISPAATFNYGPVPVRIKLKDGIGFRSLDQEIPPTMVMYESRRHLNDFLIEDGRVIDSWSFGTAEHYDEIVEDVLRIASNENGQGYALRPPVGQGLNRLFSVMVTERSIADEKSLKKVLLQMLQMVVNDQGRIVYQRGSCRSETNHFSKRY